MLERPITPASAVEALLGRFDRPTIASTIEVLVALLDVTDGDPDVELNGDELDVSATFTGRDPVQHDSCDPSRGYIGEDDEQDDPGDIAWIEHHTRGRHEITAHGDEPFDPDGEDNELDDQPEDDDPGGGNVEDTGEMVNEDGDDQYDYAGWVPVYGVDQCGPTMGDGEAGDTFAATSL